MSHTYLIGFSGGADSTAALLWTLEKMQGKAQIIAVHFNHHLRGSESDAEAANAGKFAADRGVEFRLIDLDIAPGSNLEARARRARLDAWKKLCGEYENPVVVTGHHQDDCIENMFLRIGRGSNVSGLTGLHLCSEVEGVNFFRPLLIMSRSDIEKFLAERGVTSWAVDSSNLECEYSRNVLRNQILPELYRLFPGGRKAVAQTLENLQEDAAALDRMATAFFDNAGKSHCETAFWQLYENETALAVRMLRLLCREFFADDAPVSTASFARFMNMVSGGGNGKLELDKKRTLVFVNGMILPGRENPSAVEWNWRKYPQILWNGYLFKAEKVDSLPAQVSLNEAFFDGGSLPDILNVGAPRDGEKMLPFGGQKMVKVKKLRIDRKIPAVPVLPLLRGGDDVVLWMTFVRHSAHHPVRPEREIIRIFAEKAE